MNKNLKQAIQESQAEIEREQQAKTAWVTNPTDENRVKLNRVLAEIKKAHPGPYAEDEE
jgi:hypothetical protein